MLKWYRSWPEIVPEDRAYVVDNLPKLIMRDLNYATLEEYQPWPDHEPGFCMLEWDVALGQEERRQFAEHALVDPDRVLVAPYYIYTHRGQGIQVHRMNGHPIDDGQAWAHTFGFGCIYFPKSILNAWWAEPPKFLRNRWNDTLFSTWYWSQFGSCEVDWSVRPQHLHEKGK